MWGSKRLNLLLWWANGAAALAAIHLLSAIYFFRIDLTEERRYTIKPQTRALLQNLDEPAYVEVFLEGDLNAGFKRMQRELRELLEEFRILSGNRLRYVFTNPSAAAGKKAQSEFMQGLAAMGINPVNVIENRKGERVEKIIFPGAMISYGGADKGVNLLKGNRSQGSEEALNESIEGLEFELANGIYQLANTDRKRVGLVVERDRADSLEHIGFEAALQEQYDVQRIDLDKTTRLEGYDAIAMVKPIRTFSELDKWKLDQYVMRGGALLLLIDPMRASMDSLVEGEYYALPYPLELDDMLFRYGVRLNNDLIEDRLSALYPIVTGQVGGQPQITQIPWPFFPMINNYATHVITRNLDASLLRFASSIDTVKAVGVKKTPLLRSSPLSAQRSAPVRISIANLRNDAQTQQLSGGPFAVAYLLEGAFTSLYKNRILPAAAEGAFVAQSPPTKIIVVSDGDAALNSVSRSSGLPQPLGYDAATGYTFANKDLLLNMMAYLTDENGLINTRSKEVKVRPLNKVAAKADRLFWQTLNLALPLGVVVLYGIIRSYARKRKYATPHA